MHLHFKMLFYESWGLVKLYLIINSTRTQQKLSTFDCFQLPSEFNACHAESIKMPRPLPIFSRSDYLIQFIDINSHAEWQTVQIQVQKSTSGFTLFA